MLEPFYPKEWLDSTYLIPWGEWYDQGIRGAIFDVDNTLVPHGAPADEKAIALFERLHGMGMKTCLLSNNKEPRVASFAAQVDSPYIYKAAKPSVKNYRRAMEIMGTETGTTLFVGDQLFTDVYGANRAGIYGILVKPINPKEEIQIVLKRYLEAVVLYFYKRSAKQNK
ncbi:MAG: YqeG family HAD IIIA-type phosphatase [Lachnospiraceae bacterium]|nr:YqeG family HAD IIIA-type phosphatase [Lachnospiraceae bacterium]